MTSIEPRPIGVAVVVGASRGLGRGVAEALAAESRRVVAIARDGAALDELARSHAAIVPIVGDATDERLAARVVAEHAPDLLVMNAGAKPVLGSLHEQTWDGFMTNWNTDTKAAFVWLKEALRAPMKPGAHVIVVASGAALQGSPVSGGYAPAKRAQWFLTEYAKNESARGGLGLVVHCLLPNLNPSTDLGRAGIAAYAARAGVTPEEFAKRFGEPLTPAILGRSVIELAREPARFEALAWRVGGAGLFAV